MEGYVNEGTELLPHEAHYNLIAAALATAAATILTLLTTLGTADVGASGEGLKALLESELLVIETTLIVSVVALLRHSAAEKKRLVIFSSFLLIAGTVLIWLHATVIIFS